MLDVELIEIFLKLGELSSHFGLVLDIRLHLFFLELDTLLKNSLLSVQLLDLALLIFTDCFSFRKLV